jgi:hypothetical protein
MVSGLNCIFALSIVFVKYSLAKSFETYVINYSYIKLNLRFNTLVSIMYKNIDDL